VIGRRERGRPTEDPALAAGSPILDIVGVDYHYPGGVQALSGVNLTLQAQEVVAIVGPSGCGKSTLLGLVAGLINPTAGSLKWGINATEARNADRRRLAMVFQRDTVLAWRTVEANVRFGMEFLSISESERQERVEDLLRLGNLLEFRKAHPRQLSGGMRRRLGLLMALAVRPSVLLLDEPFSALDEPTRVGLSSDVLKLAYEYGVTVVLVTHDLGEAISIADRVIVMSSRPATVQHSVEVGFGHDRNVFTLREHPEFGELYAELWRELRKAIGVGDGPDADIVAAEAGLTL